jgi:hypothetical protein
VLDEAFAMARSKYERDVQPQREALSLTQKALAENKAKADAMLETIGASGITPELLAMLNEKAGELRRERNGLLLEAHKLESMMQPLQEGFDALPLHLMLSRFSIPAQAAKPSEMQRIVRAAAHKMEWMPERECVVDFYSFPGQTQTSGIAAQGKLGGDSRHLDLCLERNVRYGSPQRSTFEPLIYRLRFLINNLVPKLEIPNFGLYRMARQANRRLLLT